MIYGCKEPLHVGIADIAGQGDAFFHPVVLPYDRIRPHGIICLASQKLEHPTQTSQPTVDGSGGVSSPQLILYETRYVLPRHIPRRFIYETLENPQIADVVSYRGATRKPSLQIPFELLNRCVHWLSPGTLHYTRQLNYV
jgi:hypothetical protein